jgi:hypothetical protein
VVSITPSGEWAMLELMISQQYDVYLGNYGHFRSYVTEVNDLHIAFLNRAVIKTEAINKGEVKLVRVPSGN